MFPHIVEFYRWNNLSLSGEELKRWCSPLTLVQPFCCKNTKITLCSFTMGLCKLVMQWCNKTPTLKATNFQTAGLKWFYTSQPRFHLLFPLSYGCWCWKKFWLLVSSKASVPTAWHPETSETVISHMWENNIFWALAYTPTPLLLR